MYISNNYCFFRLKNFRPQYIYKENCLSSEQYVYSPLMKCCSIFKFMCYEMAEYINLKYLVFVHCAYALITYADFGQSNRDYIHILQIHKYIYYIPL